MATTLKEDDTKIALPPPPSVWQSWVIRLAPVGSILAGFLLWEILVRVFVPNRTVIIVPPSAIVQAAWRLALEGEIWQDIATSLQEFGLGMLLAVIGGVGLAVVMALNKSLRLLMDPWVAALFSTPTVAVAPLFIFILGVGTLSKVGVVFVVALFPILLNSHTGLRLVDPELIEAGHSFSARPWQILRHIMLPGALPMIFAGLRVGMARGLVGVVVGEMLGSMHGVGHLIFTSGQMLQTADLFFGVLLLMLTGATINSGLNWLERRLAPWASRQMS